MSWDSCCNINFINYAPATVLSEIGLRQLALAGSDSAVIEGQYLRHPLASISARQAVVTQNLGLRFRRADGPLHEKKNSRRRCGCFSIQLWLGFLSVSGHGTSRILGIVHSRV